MKQFIKANSVLLLILAVSIFFRFWQISNLPAGLFPDEAANGLDVNSIFDGKLQPFYERGNGREALFFYFLALSVAVFGRSPFSHHLVSAGFGFFGVLTTYFLAKRLFGKRVALLASFFMAVSSYAVTISRTAFRANTIPLFTTLTILFLVKLFQSKDEKSRLWSALFAGISFGLGFYTYISFRMMVPLLVGSAVLLLLACRDRLREIVKTYWKPKLLFGVGFLASFAWLGLYFFTHPGSFVGRAGQVSIFSQDLNQGDVLGTFVSVFKQTMLGFFTEGDLNWRHNVSGYSFLSPFLSPFFALSLIIFTWAIFVLIKQTIQKNVQKQTVYQALIAAWFWLMLTVEVITAEGIPHGLRLVGVIPAIFILPAWSINKAWTKIKSISYFKPMRMVFVVIFLSSLFIYNFYLYFVVAGGSPEYYYAFRSDLTVASNYLNARNDKARTYLSLDKFSVQTTDYLTTKFNQPYQLLDPASTFEVKLKKGDQVVFTQSTLFDRTKFEEYHPDAKLVKQEQNQFGQTIMLVYEQP